MKSLLAIPLLVTLAHAQSVAATIATPGGSSLNAALPARTPVAQALAAQTLALPFSAAARDVDPFSGQVAVATLGIDENLMPGLHELSFRNGVTVSSPGSASASSGLHLFTISYTAPVATPVYLSIEGSITGTPGQPLPRIEVDVLSRNGLEFSNQNPLTWTGLELVGPNPLQVTVRLDASVAGTGILRLNQVLSLQIRPANTLDINRAVRGCLPTQGLFVVPGFLGQGISVQLPYNPLFNLGVAAFGFSQRPVVLPGQPLAPCLLLPATDIVVVMPPSSTIEVALPPSVRPAQFWVQGAVFSFGSPAIGLTDAFEVVAY